MSRHDRMPRVRTIQTWCHMCFRDRPADWLQAQRDGWCYLDHPGRLSIRVVCPQCAEANPDLPTSSKEPT